MTTYRNLHWESLNYIKKHLYRRIATPLNNALGRLAIARHVDDLAEAHEQYRRVEQNLETALNLVKAWAALVHVKSGGVIRREQRRQIAPDELPEWLIDLLNTQTAFRVEHTQPVLVHPETFYETLQLLALIGEAVGTLKNLITGDALDTDDTVWMRAILDPPQSGPYATLGALFKRFDTPNPADQEVMFQLQVLQEMLLINGGVLRLQNNRRTGEQSLAASVPVASSAERVEERVADLRAGTDESHETMSMYAHLLAALDRPEAVPSGSEPPSNGAKQPVHESVEVENRSETLIVPPPNFREQLAARLQSPAESPADDGEVETNSSALIVPPPNFRERLAAHTRDVEKSDGERGTSGPSGGAENRSESLIVPLPPLRDRPAESKPEPESAPRKPVTGPFGRPPDPGLIEVVEPENASDTLIVPPPDYRRRLVTRRLSPPVHGLSDTEPEDKDSSAPTE